MYGFTVPHIPFTLRLNDVLGYVQADFAIDHPGSAAIKSCLAFHDPNFVAEKSCSASLGMRNSVAERLTEGLYSALEPDRTGTMLS
jgi:hypothetical protein